jgi:hypothetical protein
MGTRACCNQHPGLLQPKRAGLCLDYTDTIDLYLCRARRQVAALDALVVEMPWAAGPSGRRMVVQIQ